jgi:DNA-binding response OmpR family regulator
MEMNTTDNQAKTVLLAEDNQFIQRGYKIAIEEAGYRVVTVSNGADVIPSVTAHKPSVIVLDLILPNKNGFDILKELRSMEEFRSLPVIIATSLGQEEDREKVFACGATDYLVKQHATVQMLIEKIDHSLGI